MGDSGCVRTQRITPPSGCKEKLPKISDEEEKKPRWEKRGEGSRTPRGLPARVVPGAHQSQREKPLIMPTDSVITNQIAQYYKPVVRELLEQGYIRIGQGNNRVAYAKDSSHVIKIPTNLRGVVDSDREAQEFKMNGKFDGDRHLAECHVEMIEKQPVLWMEYVEPIPITPDVRKENSWIDFVDCAQVGNDQKGNLVAYDYA